jgi:flagellar motor protein MotB
MMCITASILLPGGPKSALARTGNAQTPPHQHPSIDSLIDEYTDIRKWFIKAHSEHELDSINQVIQDIKSIPWIARLRGKKEADKILENMQLHAAEETARYQADIEKQKRLFAEMNPDIYDRRARDVMFYDDGRRFVFLPMGMQSFADKVVEYTVGRPAPNSEIYMDPRNALTPPGVKYDKQHGFGAVSLGCGGSLTVEFTDNALVDINGPDLYIFETFRIMEPTFIAISTDGFEWIDLGILDPTQTAIDIHDFVEEGDVFHFVQLTDHGLISQPPPGADIDAVAAIGSALRASFEVTVLFDHDRHIPRPEADQTLSELASAIAEYDEAHISVTGHTDDVGDEDYNMELSRKRVASIVDRLQGKLPEGDYAWSEYCFGETRPVAENMTPEGRARNRRVEVLVRWMK